MPHLSIKDVPEAMAHALRERAARNHRSLQGELMAIIEQAALDDMHGASSIKSATAQGGQRGGLRRGWKTIEQIAAEHRQRFPEPIRGGPLSVDIIRADRDSR